MVLDLLRVFLLSLGVPWMLLGAFLLITFVSLLIDHHFLSAEEACCFSVSLGSKPVWEKSGSR
jgi:hypothetical protein